MAPLNVRASLYISLTGPVMSLGQHALRLLIFDGERFVCQGVLLERSASLIVPVDEEAAASSGRLLTQPLRGSVLQNRLIN